MSNTAQQEQRAARAQLDSHGWISRRSEAFRHLPPPAAEQWLAGSDNAPQGAGWTWEAPNDAAQVTAQRLNALHPEERAQLLAGLPHPGSDEAAPFAWAHRALCTEGLRVSVRAGDPAALHLHHQSRSAAEAPLLVLHLEPGAQCVLLETHDFAPQAAQNLQTHIHLAPGARLTHLRVAGAGAQQRIAHHLHATLAEGARYAQATVATAAGYHLQRSTLALQGAGAQSHVAQLLLAGGPARQVDQQAYTRMDAPHTASTVETLALAQHGAHAVANAHTRIAPGADEASVRQRLTGVPLAGNPRLVLRPHLEILHDNVQAAHGATWGALPEDALFYARQRGLDEASARALIIEGMARALLGRALEGDAAGSDLLARWLDTGWLASTIAAHLQAPDGEERHG
ncbi:SufD family Fe-S cluster assembly protein [Pulveribacter suum]|uniref:SufBD protein n=1 Tax=Pulveribacter suum TaxID=2116657 RepID=A0A2P1NLZ5_9BURK|nr:SufD family Fe-S cluster assembly protein [Pulveribacter suum]AVP58017.1 SufBD protein [Pulveribacter suum]